MEAIHLEKLRRFALTAGLVLMSYVAPWHWSGRSFAGPSLLRRL